MDLTRARQDFPLFQKKPDQKIGAYFDNACQTLHGVPMVGPKPYRVYAIQLEGLFFWMK